MGDVMRLQMFSNTTVIFIAVCLVRYWVFSLSGVIAANIMFSAERHTIFQIQIIVKKLPGKPGTALTGNDQK